MNNSWSQGSLRVVPDSTVIHVGAPLGVRVEYHMRDSVSARFVWPDSIPHFEWVEKNNPQLEMRGKEKWLVQKIVLTSYDTGHWMIPSVSLQLKDKKLQSAPVPIAVFYSSYSLASNYHDIKEIVPVPAPPVYWPYWTTAFLLVIAAVFFYRRYRLKRASSAPLVAAIKISPFDQAMQEMKLLKEQLKHKHPDMKIFYTSLVDIFRKYISDQRQFSSMEKTNGELIVYLNTCQLPADQLSQLVKQLELADAVKFALHKPGHEEAEKSFFLLELAMKYLNQ